MSRETLIPTAPLQAGTQQVSGETVGPHLGLGAVAADRPLSLSCKRHQAQHSIKGCTALRQNKTRRESARRGCRGSSVLKSTSCPSKRPEFNSQHPHQGSSKLLVTPAVGCEGLSDSLLQSPPSPAHTLQINDKI